MTNCSALYDDLYRQGYRKALHGFDVARWHALDHFIARVVRPPRAAAVLDYGSGSGLFAGLIAARFPTAQIAFCDVSTTALAQLEANYPQHAGRTAAIVDDRAALPDASFDIVVSIEVMEHVLDLKAYLADVCRLLKPGGWFIWSTPSANRGSIEHLYCLATGAIDATAEGYRRWRFEDPTHVRRLTTCEAAVCVAAAGFDDIVFRHRSHLFSFLVGRWFPSRWPQLGEWLMGLDYALFRRLPNGASMLGAARKQTEAE